MSIFTDKAPGIMRLLMADFALDVDSAAAVLGNLGHESGGFKFLQEKKPLVPNSKGGYGWAQWTGPRRKAYEAYCKRNKLDPASDKANYGFLFVELSGSEKGAIPAVKKAKSLYDKVVAFELAFERAGIKHYDSRFVWAKRALAAYEASPAPAPQPDDPGVATAPARPAPAPPAPEAAVTVLALLAGWLTENVALMAACAAVAVSALLAWRYRDVIKRKIGIA